MQLDETTRTTWDVRHYGAAGDGTTDDTAAIQLAVDRCHAAGGGQVLLPAGRFLAGTIGLRSRVQLHLTSGAQLIAGARLLAGPVDADGAPLITARGQEQVSITGTGVIDGAAAAGPLIVTEDCHLVRVHEVTLRHAPHGALILTGCDDAEIRGVRVTNPAGSRTGDGIAVIDCRDVLINDCRIRSGAAGLVLRGADPAEVDHDSVSGRVIVGGCTIAGAERGIRIAGGGGVVRHGQFTDLMITDCGVGVEIDGEAAGAGRVEQLRFSNLIIDGHTPIIVRAGTSSIRDLAFTGMTITASSTAELVGSDATPVQQIRLADADWRLRSEGGAAPDVALRGRHLDHLIVDGVTVHRDGALGGNGHAGFVFEHTERLMVRRLTEDLAAERGERS